MLYRNTKTGAVIDVSSIMSGDWQEVKPASPAHASEQPKSTTEKAVKNNGRNIRKSK